MSFHHVAVATRNLAATHAFYTQAMGFDLVKVEAAATDGGGWARHAFYDTTVKASSRSGTSTTTKTWPPTSSRHCLRGWAFPSGRITSRSTPAIWTGSSHASVAGSTTDTTSRDRPWMVHVDLRRGRQWHARRVVRDDAGVHRRRPRRRAAPPYSGAAAPRGGARSRVPRGGEERRRQLGRRGSAGDPRRAHTTTSSPGSSYTACK
jgi:catechol 2,3-dioxygenase-like lactoylglutathione lyase family enzyme